MVQAESWYPVTVGRSVGELLRLLAALQRVEKGDALAPEGWRPGSPVVLPACQMHDAVTEAGPDWFMTLQPDGAK